MMIRRLALKRLTASDLTFFEWQYRNRNAGNQKAINLNRDVFIDLLYPSLPAIAERSDGKLSLDLTLLGPGMHGSCNLQRKIVKFGTYKNWRLNGEFVHNPEEEPDRFNCLEPDDLAIFDFRGDLHPISATVLFLCHSLQEDFLLHSKLSALLGKRKMTSLTSTQLEEAIDGAELSAEHPANELGLEAAIEDAARGGIIGTERLLKRRSGRKLSKAELRNARDNADSVGELGEEFVSAYFDSLVEKNELSKVDWSSRENAVSPYDFKVVNKEGVPVLLDVKSTLGDFERVMHISLSELRVMSDSSYRYDLYRVYGIDRENAKLRIAKNVNDFGKRVLDAFSKLPEGVIPDSISVSPKALSFGAELTIAMSVDEQSE